MSETTRAEKWEKFDDEQRRFDLMVYPPAYVQESVVGLWSVQTLCRPNKPHFGLIHRMMFDPPSCHPGEPFYQSWPGGQDGWMNFESKESARDFFKLRTGKITFEEYRKRPSGPYSGITIAMDENGEFTDEKIGGVYKSPETDKDQRAAQ